jgi:probable F420-dependent oxidoreductase
MRLSVVLPQQEIGMDGAAIRTWARTLDQWGLDEIEAFDHVLGGSPDHWSAGPPPGFQRAPYTTEDAFHEPLILFGHLAAVTTRIGFATSVLVLSQRQTVVVAKQCAEISVLSNGRLRLGVGVGWNDVEHEALGYDFGQRGKRVNEQIEVLKALWSTPVVTYQGQWHSLDRVGINPLPIGGTIPIWVGGMSDAAVRRAARLADGWSLNIDVSDPRAAKVPGRLAQAAEAAGRPRDSIGLSGWIKLAGRSPAEWERDAEAWVALGVDQVGLVTLGAGMGPQCHLELVERFLEKSSTSLGRTDPVEPDAGRAERR